MTTTRPPWIAAAVEAGLFLVAILLFVFFNLKASNGIPASLASLLPAVALLLCIAGMGLLQARFGVGRLTLPILMFALVVFDVSRLAGVWPCDVGCQGGAHYQTIAGVSVVWPALAAHLAMAVLAVRDLRLGSWCAWTRRTLGLLAGTSWFFSGISTQLGLDCTYCSAVHWTTFGAWISLIAAWPSSERWWQTLSWPLAGWLLANAVFHHTPVRDVSAAALPPPTTAPSTREADLLRRIEHGRTRGDEQAPATLELALDLFCRSCAEHYDPLLKSLAPAIAGRQVKVVVRHVVRPSQPASREAMRLVLVAAAYDMHATVLATLLGTSDGATIAGMQARLEEVMPSEQLVKKSRDDATILDRVLAADAARLAELKVGIRTPSAVLLRDGREIGRWSGDFAPALVVDALGR